MKFFFSAFYSICTFFCCLCLSVCLSLSLCVCVWGYVWDGGGRMGLNYTSKAHQAEQEASKTPERGEVSAGFPLGNVFALQEPKHALAGLSGAAQNLVVGVGVGLGSLLALPVVNGHRDGAKGVAKGVAMGVAALVGMTTYGVATGARQFAKGVYNTKEAVVEAARGERYWDSQQGRWVDVHLDSAFAELPAGDEDLFTQAREAFGKMFTGISSNTTHASEGAAAAPLKDYYAIMGVQRTATAAEIRSAFHRKALEMHPDKNPNNAEATLRFQEVLEANNILSDEGRRAHYDKYGSADSILDQNSSYMQFEEALGANFMEMFVGRLSYALYFIPNTFLTDGLKKEFQRRRTLRLAQRLICIVDDEGRLEAVLPAIRDAVSTRMGPKLMSIVAQQYIAAARQHLSGSLFLRQLDIFATSKWSRLVQMADVTAVGIPAALKAARSTLKEDDQVDILVTLCEGDVQRTVLRASRLILYDTSVTSEKRRKRAENLSILGKMVEGVCRMARSSE
ncbi:hypothetical protein, conserved [Trypanosoma cruzi]|uniref:J domain-containing protein n=1 Tax=Trypanosoma cruzi (strain CL Brener) TaxID=353153 RepID=Q4CT18_TRYCC|nr:hypothetical protein, conserved [Trypanosoma cruzi]EAN83417.1 hypothetical protein, conserved [Trypanosoma cruzi]|eukprot:XP_805268.1 hypothetical protein [Trypanosoma cruzi strain CL Brener]